MEASRALVADQAQDIPQAEEPEVPAARPRLALVSPSAGVEASEQEVSRRGEIPVSRTRVQELLQEPFGLTRGLGKLAIRENNSSLPRTRTQTQKLLGEAVRLMQAGKLEYPRQRVRRTLQRM